MLYNQGDNFQLIYYQGKPVSQIWMNGKCIYPGLYNTPSILESFLMRSNDFTSVTKIVISNQKPPTGVSVQQLSNYYESITARNVDYSNYVANIDYYDFTKTYNVGDVVVAWSMSTGSYSSRNFMSLGIYTCLKNIEYPEPFNSDNWISGSYPELIGEYSNSVTYNVGDVVGYRTSFGLYVRTCRQAITEPESYDSAKWFSFYMPKLREYDPTLHYIVGSTVVYDNNYYTCIQEHTPNNSWISDYWVSEYWPDLVGKFDISQIYHYGDNVCYRTGSSGSYRAYVCKSRTDIIGIYPTNSNYWASGYNGIKKYVNYDSYDTSIQYEFGDIYQVSTNTPRLVLYPNIPYSTADAPITYGWLAGNIYYIYTEGYKITTSLAFRLPYPPYSQAPTWSISDISGLSAIDTSLAIDMTQLFASCININNLQPISNWNVSNVRSLQFAFSNCQSLQSVTALSTWDVSNVIYMGGMCADCNTLSDISGFLHWNTSNVTILDSYWNSTYGYGWIGCFHNCYALQSLHGLEYWDVSKVTSLISTFYNCSALTDISALSDWDVSNVLKLTSTFSACSSLSDISALSNWNVCNVTEFGLQYSYANIQGMFRNCTSLQDISPIAYWNMSSATTIAGMFMGCSSITSISNLHWNMQSCTDYHWGFYQCTSVTEIRELYWSNVQSGFNDCFNGCTSLVKADFSRCAVVNPEGYTAGYTFEGCPNLESCDLGEVITETSMGIWTAEGRGTFADCTKLSLLVIRNTHKVLARPYYYGYGDGLSNLIRNNGKVYVPQALLADYQASDDWIVLINAGVEVLPLEGSPYEQPGSI